ncbi:hypothetical protein DUI87_05866 [Hirundo rustica rustica]|uniref:Uncharacterized protein n=1 Tax=Hirundo rustica rustica TaxID=333673 RepID=A0A3M0KWV1_HIRRU|nr:hypothetical protein DUI87_05866 [Hirundo rustica rustica]
MVLHGERPDPAGHAQVLAKGSPSSGKLCFPKGCTSDLKTELLPAIEKKIKNIVTNATDSAINPHANKGCYSCTLDPQPLPGLAEGWQGLDPPGCRVIDYSQRCLIILRITLAILLLGKSVGNPELLKRGTTLSQAIRQGSGTIEQCIEYGLVNAKVAHGLLTLPIFIGDPEL